MPKKKRKVRISVAERARRRRRAIINFGHARTRVKRRVVRKTKGNTMARKRRRSKRTYRRKSYRRRRSSFLGGGGIAKPLKAIGLGAAAGTGMTVALSGLGTLHPSMGVAAQIAPFAGAATAFLTASSLAGGSGIAKYAVPLVATLPFLAGAGLNIGGIMGGSYGKGNVI
jgi:hypothetical protein